MSSDFSVTTVFLTILLPHATHMPHLASRQLHYNMSAIRTPWTGQGQTSAFFLNHHSTPSWEWSMSTTRVTHYPLQSLDSSPEKPEKPHAVRRVHKIISYVVITSLLAPSHTVRPKLKMPTVYHLLLTGISEFIQYMHYLYCEHYTNSCQREFSVWSMHVLFAPMSLSLKSMLNQRKFQEDKWCEIIEHFRLTFFATFICFRFFSNICRLPFISYTQ